MASWKKSVSVREVQWRRLIGKHHPESSIARSSEVKLLEEFVLNCQPASLLIPWLVLQSSLVGYLGPIEDGTEYDTICLPRPHSQLRSSYLGALLLLMFTLFLRAPLAVHNLNFRWGPPVLGIHILFSSSAPLGFLAVSG